LLTHITPESAQKFGHLHSCIRAKIHRCPQEQVVPGRPKGSIDVRNASAPRRLLDALAERLDWRRIPGPPDGDEAGAEVVRRNEERLSRMLAFIRVAVVPFLAVPLLTWDRLPRPWIILITLPAAAVEAGLFLRRVRRRKEFKDDVLLAVGDAAFCVLLMLAGSRAGFAGQRNQLLTEFVPFSLVSPAIVAFIGGLRRWALGAVAVLAGTWVLAVWPDITPKLGSDVLGFIVWYLAGLAVATLLRGMAAQIARATARALEQQQLLDLALHRQHVEERLHHGVLPILDHIARNPALTLEERRAASRGSLWTRNLFAVEGSDPSTFGHRVRETADHFLDLGLMLEHKLYLDADPPPEVGRVLLEGAAEALNNALKHAGDGVEVVLQVISEPGYLLMSVIDAGRGFDRASTPHGVGYASTLPAVESIGAHFELLSEPGIGTRVRLEWRAGTDNQ
jgi:signal transduction histidine kinase